MDNKCKNCIFLKKYEEDKIFGYCINDKCKRQSKQLISELSAACRYKETVENVEKPVEKLSNKKLGSNFENDFAEYLSKKGYWVAQFPGKDYTNSQPADMIACKNDKPYLVDCKTLANKSGTFTLDRLEQNQRMAYKRFKEAGNKNYYLAILWNNNVYLVSLNKIDLRWKSINVKDYTCIKENFYED